MILPGRLAATTLGDLLGTLYRARVSGALELAEPRGRIHQVFVRQGLVYAVVYDGAAPELGQFLRRNRAADDDTLRRALLRAMSSRRLHGEVLMRDFRVDAGLVAEALREQLLDRLARLEGIGDASVTFRLRATLPRGAEPEDALGSCEFLRGRKRAREDAVDPLRERALVTLGLGAGASLEDARRAYRQLVRELHPDLMQGQSDAERQRLGKRMREVNEAYRAISA
jgi:DnaJ-domain-containing protein 1